MSKKRHRTRPAQSGDFVCPVHGLTVEHRKRFSEDENGRRKFGGEYMACPRYGDCGYYVSGDMRVPVMSEIL